MNFTRLSYEQLIYSSKINPNGLFRLAKFLGYNIDGLSVDSVVELIHYFYLSEEYEEKAYARNTVSKTKI